ncbi:hypothetical protein HZA45_02140 [Candidatus Peregrinibacteria bacterium]|nr:hypothetical protein [Candidatus Peregrinibacteria bacterium]
MWFLFDLIAFWEFICNIDERMHESLSDETYEKLSLGPIIDGLEKDWPFDKKFMANVQKSYKKALRDIKAGKTRSL